MTITDRKGHFPGMPDNRKFNIVLVRPDKGAGPDTAETPDKEVGYTGKQIVVRL